MSAATIYRALATMLAATLVVTGCGLSSGGSIPYRIGPGSIVPVPELEGVAVTVGGKDFTEGVITTYLIEFMLAAAGMDVQDLSALAGSNSFREALVNGQVDIGMEYTGTAWMSYLGQQAPITDPQKQWQAVRDLDLEQNGIEWFTPTEVDNTYSFGMNQQTANETGVRNFSDYAELVNTSPADTLTCIDTEFQVRRDGFPGLAEHYGYPADKVPTAVLQSGIIYQATATGRDCRFGQVYTTDGRVKGLDLVVLEDDKNFFPVYNAAVVARHDFVEQHPQIRHVLSPLHELLDNTVVMELNARVDVEGQDPAAVARDYLVSEGLITAD